jgi:hypothetical protein
MSNYSFKALDADGGLIRGVLEADTISSVHENLTARGLFVLHVKESSLILRKISEATITWKMERTLSKKRILELYLNCGGVGGRDLRRRGGLETLLRKIFIRIDCPRGRTACFGPS